MDIAITPPFASLVGLSEGDAAAEKGVRGGNGSLAHGAGHPFALLGLSGGSAVPGSGIVVVVLVLFFFAAVGAVLVLDLWLKEHVHSDTLMQGTARSSGGSAMPREGTDSNFSFLGLGPVALTGHFPKPRAADRMSGGSLAPGSPPATCREQPLPTKPPTAGPASTTSGGAAAGGPTQDRDSLKGSPYEPPPLPQTPGHLVSGLVVPEGQECLLAAPMLRPGKLPKDETVTMSLRDLRGTSVIRCEVTRPAWDGSDKGPPSVALHSPFTQEVLATCRARNVYGMRSACVYDAKGELFAHVMKEPHMPTYRLSTAPPQGGATGQQFVFAGDFDKNVRVTPNGQQEACAEIELLMMDMEPEPYVDQQRLVRVAPRGDVSIIVCGLMCIDLLRGGA